MDKEDLNEEVENVEEEIQELTEDEGEETTGGIAGYGDSQFQCVCGQNCLCANALLEHLKTSKHKSAKMYYQKAKGKGHRGAYIGTVKVQYQPHKVTIIYPNGKQSSMKY